MYGFDPYQPTPADWQRQQDQQQAQMQQYMPSPQDNSAALYAPMVSDDLESSIKEMMARLQQDAQRKKNGQSGSSGILSNLLTSGGGGMSGGDSGSGGFG